MLQRLKRKRGGQPGNKNAVGNKGPVTHGRFTRAAKEARWARWQKLQAEWKEQQRRSDEWIKSQPGYKPNYARIIDELIRLRLEQEAAEARRLAHLKLALSPRSRRL